MNNILQTAKHIHFIGVGGIGISAAARMVHAMGIRVTANDLGEFPVIPALRAEGIEVVIGKDISVIPDDSDAVVYSVAWDNLAPELLQAVREKKIPLYTYPELLGLLSQKYFTIAVSGTAGKTTVTAMIAKIMLDAGLDPTVIVGSLLIDEKSNFIAGKSKYLIVEADEYKRAFNHLSPNILVINNITPDHLDYYKDLSDIQKAFHDVAKKVPNDGFIVCDTGDKNITPAIFNTTAAVVNYTEYKNIVPKLKLPGAHNISNAAAAAAVASALGISEEKIIKSLQEFAGTWRRFEYKGKAENGALIYDDYAHNPEKIQAALAGAREMFPGHRIFAVFQPHLYSRTKLLFDKFTESFQYADEIILSPIYAAREENDPSITSEILAAGICQKGKSAMVCNTQDDIEKEILSKTRDGDVIVFIGAGDLNKLAERMVKK